jgi:1-acyl-sn-glycerol-3-phosphate acyltransferase
LSRDSRRGARLFDVIAAKGTIVYNIGLTRVKYLTTDNFTSDLGLKIRRAINPIMRKIIVVSSKNKLIVEPYPKLVRNRPYIFASTHSFPEDIAASVVAIDRNAYVLLGGTDQIDHNPQMYMAWVNGMIYVDRQNRQSRKDAVDKMERVLKKGSSILIFPEGRYNDSENMLCLPLFSGAWQLAVRTGLEVVPISSFNEHGSKKAYIRVGEPLNLSGKSKEEALTELRDALATMRFEQVEQYSTKQKRSELGADYHLDYMEERRKEWMSVKWTRDVWDEELSGYSDRNHPAPQEVRASLAKVRIMKDNVNIFLPALKMMAEDERYDFKRYMKENWDRDMKKREKGKVLQ